VKIAIVGAGPSGLVTAAVLQRVGHDVVVFEKALDIGGVWSASRNYPGVTTQDDRVTYSFSDMPMPDDFPEHPSGAQVRAYLQDYTRVKGLQDRIHLGARVDVAEPDADGSGWLLRVLGPRGPETHQVDWLVAANGVFSAPHVPAWPGRNEFEALGGRVISPTELGDGADLEGRDVVVVGWGKTACDVATASSRTARSTTVVARTIRWKIPKQISPGLTFRQLLLTRLGEQLMTPSRASLRERIGALLALPVRRTVGWMLRSRIAHRSGLQALGLMPSTPLPHSDSLVSEGFFEAIAAGHVTVRREQSVASLGAADGASGLRLADDTWLQADVVVPATGFDQDVSFLTPSVQAALTSADGAVELYRRILPLNVPGLAFAGWGHTYRSPLTAEIGAVWLAAHIAGCLRSPAVAEMRDAADRYHLTHERAATRGESQLPSGSFAALDVLLEDLAMPLPPSVRLRQWYRPINPTSYSYLLPALCRRLGVTDGGRSTELSRQTQLLSSRAQGVDPVEVR
jgi:dimethylaniline monooxygenase (N-oxide forming)